MFHAYAATSPGGAFEPIAFDPGPLQHDQVEIAVTSCGICHSDLSMLDNEWGLTTYPFVGGHEVVGRVAAVGEHVPADHLKVGDAVGLGWFSRSCGWCDPCVSGRQNLCPRSEGTIVGRHGGFADRVRAHWGWVAPIPPGINLASAGPLFCGGITVFNPLIDHDIRPTARVGVIGIGGLGHLAIRFLDRWGCDVTAFSSSPDKEPEVRAMGADHFVNAKDADALKKLAGSFDMVLNTTNVRLDWDAYVQTLKPGGVLHTVGAVLDSFGVSNAFPLIGGGKRLAGSPLGSPATVRAMLVFCARHRIQPTVETYPLARINDAFEKLRHGSPRYRLVLQAS